MNRLLKIIAFLFLTAFFVVGTSFAGYLDGYNNITIKDGHGEKGFTSGGSVGPTGQGLEDQEVEPGALANQDWDLEGFFQSDSLLALVGGWDFVGGETYNGIHYESGDIFFETDDTNPGFEYVLYMDFNSEKYSVISGNFETYKTTGGPTGSNGLDWRYSSGGTLLSSGNSFSDYQAGLTDSNMGGSVTGGVHNAVVVDLSFLNAGTNFTSFFTMECGNDIVNGSGTGGTGSASPVPELSTMLLLGVGLISIAGISRRKLKK